MVSYVERQARYARLKFKCPGKYLDLRILPCSILLNKELSDWKRSRSISGMVATSRLWLMVNVVKMRDAWNTFIILTAKSLGKGARGSVVC